MDQLIQVLIIGFANGLIFALVALGYTLVYGIIELINFAHGDVFMLGSMLAFFLVAPASSGGWAIFPIDEGMAFPLKVAEILVVLAICMVMTALLNVAIERVAYRPLRNAPKLAPLISAIGMSYVLQNIGLVLGRRLPAHDRQRLPVDQPARTVRDHRDRGHARPAVRRRGHDPASHRPDPVRQPDPAGPRDASHGAGS